MEKTLKIEITGLNNSARAVKDRQISIEKLLSMQDISIESITADIKFVVENPDYCGRPISEVLAEKIENIISCAEGWVKNGYKLDDSIK